MARAVVDRVVREIKQRVVAQPSLQRRKVAALYFGGATANMTPPDAFERLCSSLSAAFDLSEAEVTLEGVPIHFARGRCSLMEIMRNELPARHFRISIGIQTFSKVQLERMGRLAFGTPADFRQAVEGAHRRGFTASADLLVNLPHQSLEEMRRDVRRAIDLGLDHLGLYHLVLFAGLGTAWSHNPSMLEGLPSNDRAAANWLKLRELLLSNGFRQTTLTNFERADLEGDPRRFVYEEYSFRPNDCEVLGCGPTAISYAADSDFESARKTMNPVSATEYMAAVASGRGAWEREFDYGPRDLRILYLTRRLAALNIDRAAYRELFGTDAIEDFSRELELLEKEGLVEVSRDAIRPTPKGIFYADTTAGLLAWRRLESFGRQPTSVMGRGRAQLASWQKEAQELAGAGGAVPFALFVMVVVDCLGLVVRALFFSFIAIISLLGLLFRGASEPVESSNDNSGGHM
jgi:oxygen-independent coproporphyrinogen-3 oxidase